jgi:hypothetical protein
MGKRKARRQSAIQRVAEGNVDQPSPLRIDTVLASVDPDDPGRTQTIVNGLPNVPEGFPSDHIPIGVLFIFSPQPTYTRDDIENLNSIDNGDDLGQDFGPGVQEEPYLQMQNDAAKLVPDRWLFGYGTMPYSAPSREMARGARSARGRSGSTLVQMEVVWRA